MNRFKLTIEFKVSDEWVEDGCNPHTESWKEAIEDAITGLLPYAGSHEVSAKLLSVSGTTSNTCLKLQGY